MPLYKAILVGAGSMGRAWAKNLHAHPDVTIAAWIDIRPGAAAAAAADLNLHIPLTDTDLDTALKSAGADFVVDVTVPEAHHDVTLAALAHGLPVIGEKPMADTMARARAMVAASERAGKLYMVSQSRRYNANLRAMRGLITDHVGPLGILNSDFYIGPHFGGFRDAMASPLLLDMAIHTFDAARYLSGADPVSVYCEEFNPAWSWYAGSASATAIFEMSSGLRYTYRGSWCAEGARTSWEADWRAVGPHGTAIWHGDDAPYAEIAGAGEGFLREVDRRDPVIEDVPPGIAGSLRDFLHALDTGATPMGECHDNIRSLAMVFAAIESARQGVRVPVQA